MDTYVGIDLGGTKLLIGEVTASGEILRSRRYPSGRLNQQEALTLIQTALDEFLSQETPGNKIRAIGIGMVGRIDNQNGVWFEISPDRKETLEIGPLLSTRYGLPCFADNDVRSATKAEMRFGKGQGSQHLTYINVGTGIAAGFVIHGKLISGSHHNAGEVGHTGSGLDLRVPCECGREYCVEPVASGLGLDRCARLLAPEYPETTLPIPMDGSRVHAGDIFCRYDSDPLCRRLTDNAAAAIANLIMNLVRFTDPDTIVLGGGVLSDGFLYKRIQEKLNPYTIRYVTNGVVMTALDPNYIGLLGAAANAITAMEEKNEDHRL